jgi:hypothetical protein
MFATPVGGVNVTVAWTSPRVAATAVGATGTVNGVTAVVAVEDVLVPVPPAPVPFVATTVNVYAVPAVNPVMRWLVPVVPAFESTPPAGLEITVYPVMTVPPVAAAPVRAAKVTVACEVPFAIAVAGKVAVPIVGAAGIVNGVTELLGLDAAPGPLLFVATTVNVYAVPAVKPVMTWLVPVCPAFESPHPVGTQAGFEVTV